jgi:dipeptidyl-peptidase-4
MKILKISLLFIFTLFFTSNFAQTGITVEDVWKNYKFIQNGSRSFSWMSDGETYTEKNDGRIELFKIGEESPIEVIFDNKSNKTKEGKMIQILSYKFSQDETKLLITAESDPVYRHSSKDVYYIFDRKTKDLTGLSNLPNQMEASFSPDGSKVAFVRDNNLFYVDLVSGKEFQITQDGKFNFIINGVTDWVYEEEFGFTKAFEWSPDGKSIVFIRFDESQVPEYNMQIWGDLYPNDYRFKYPKAGEKNSEVSLKLFDLVTNKTKDINVGSEKDQYILHLMWLPGSSEFSFFRLNRLQTHLEVLVVDRNSGNSRLLYEEKSNVGIELDRNGLDLKYLDNGKEFITSSERSGYKHFYLGKISDGSLKPITKGEWEVDNFTGLDQKNKVLYYSSTEKSSIEKLIYRIDLDGKNKTLISKGNGTNGVSWNSAFKYYVASHSSANDPVVYELKNAKNETIQVLEDNASLRKKLDEYQIGIKEFIQVPVGNNISLNGYWIHPRNFDPNKKYPVLMHVYGGPGSQQVLDSFGGFDFFWYQTLLDKGYLIFCVDNRGTGGRGFDFRTVTYKNLGKYEVEDQIQAAKWIGNLPYVDSSRIGIWGWSYGGYMSSNCLFQGSDVFKTAIAVAPVTNWRYYDSIYTERYQGLPQNNAAGYDRNSPVYHVNKLKGNFLLIHGTGDDNVHFQNSVALVDALIAANKQFKTFYYPNRNHGIYGGNTRLHLYNMLTDYILNNL